MGPFFVGASLASLSKLTKSSCKWKIIVDGELVSESKYQAMIIVNGDLGKNLPLAKSVPLGSGDFYLFALKNKGIFKLPGQFKKTWDSSIVNEPEKWGFEKFRIGKSLELKPETEKPFKINIDGSTMLCKDSVKFKIIDQINLISRT